MQVSVSLEELKRMKKALLGFRSDITGMAARIERQAQEKLAIGKNCVSKAEYDVAEAEAAMRRAESELAQTRQKLEQVKDEYIKVYNEIEFKKGKLQGLEAEKGAAEGELNALLGQDDEDNKNAAAIAALQSKIAQMESECMNLRQETDGLEQRRQGLYTRRENLEREVGQCQSRLEEARRVWEQRRDKLARLKTAYQNMERELVSYVNAARNLEFSSSSTAERNAGAVQKCINSIERYLNLQL